MSAFLGPIHFWLYRKIKLQQNLADYILDNSNISSKDNLRSEANKLFGEPETRELEDVIEESNSSYKELVSQNCDEHLCHLRNLSYNDWDRIIQEHSKKANLIVSDEFLFPNEIIEQSEIFNNQKTKFIEPHKRVAVLASFPLFLLDYYGIKKFIKDEEVIEE